MSDLAVQIVNYNTKRYLQRCLHDVLRDLDDSGLDYQVAVLDNHSDDNLSDLAERYRGRRISFYSSDANRGFGAGHNFLAAKTEGRYLLILNPDLEFLEPHTITRLLRHFAGATQLAVVGPKLYNLRGAQRWDHAELHGFLGRLAERIGWSYWREREGLPLGVAWVSGAFFLTLHSVFNSVGGFDEKFFLYKEEQDICLRLRQGDWQILYNPGVKVFHYGSVVASKPEFFETSDRYFVEKHFRGKGIVAFWFLKFLSWFKYGLLKLIFYWRIRGIP